MGLLCLGSRAPVDLTGYWIAAFDDTWLIVTTIVNDPQYLSREFITSTHFKLLPDDSSWLPLPCGSGSG